MTFGVCLLGKQLVENELHAFENLSVRSRRRFAIHVIENLVQNRRESAVVILRRFAGASSAVSKIRDVDRRARLQFVVETCLNLVTNKNISRVQVSVPNDA